MYPLLLKDMDGRKKFIFSEAEAKELQLRVQVTHDRKEKVIPAKVVAWNNDGNSHELVEPSKTFAWMTARKSHGKSHGLAPKGMLIPKKGEAYLIGGKGLDKVELKESCLEKYNKNKNEQNDKNKKQDKKTVKRLKNKGKISTLSPYMYI